MGESDASDDLASTEKHLRFRPDIEGLRAVAIIFVVLYHVGWRRMSGGFLGVDVFFVLSGFLITGLLLDEIARTGTVSLVHFWARRARRLLPAAAFITMVVLVLDAVLLSPFDQIDHAGTAQAFAAYGSNILLAVRSIDYFAGSASHDPLLHTWSLSVEEQFYLFFAPMLLALAMWTIKRGHAAFRHWFTIATISLSLVSIVGCLLLVRRFPVISFYALPARAWEFGLGALTVFGVRRVDRIGRAGVELISLVALAGLLGSVLLVHTAAGQSLGSAALVPTICAAALIFTGASSTPTLIAGALSTGTPRLVGRLSYSWYLWHWPLLVYLREVKPGASVRLCAAVGLLALIPAAVTYSLVESPIRFSMRLRRQPRRVVFGALALAAITFGLATGSIGYANHILSAPRFAAIMAARTRPVVYTDGCFVALPDLRSPECTYEPGSTDTTVVLFGDSHAAQWFPAVDSVARLRGWKFVVLTKSACPSVSVAVVNAKLGRRYTECEAWRKNTVERIVELRPRLVIVSNARSYRVVTGSGVLRNDSTAVGLAEWRDGMSRTLAAVKPSGAQVVVLQDTPRMTFDVPKCLVKYVNNPSRCSAKASQALDTVVAGVEREAVDASRYAAEISLNAIICDAARCQTQRDGVVRYQDTNHLSIRYVASLAPQLSAALTRAMSLSPRR